MRRMMLGAVVAVLMAHAVPAAAAPLGSNGHGVRLTARHGRLYVVLSDAIHARLAGRRVHVECVHVFHEADSPLLGIGADDETMIAIPVLRGPIATRLRRARHDACSIYGLLRRHVQRIAKIALTPRGARYLGQQPVLANVYAFSIDPLPWYVRRAKRLFRTLHAVHLTHEGELPPGHRLGLYITLTHLYAAQRDPVGTLLFFRRDGRTITTNVMPPLAALF